MDEDTSVVSDQNAPSDDQGSAGTQDDSYQAPQDTAGDEDAKVSTGKAPADEAQKADGEDWEHKYRSLEGKTSALEKEKNDAAKRARQFEEYVKLLDEDFVNRPSEYEKYRTRYQQRYGRELPPYEQIYGTQRGNTSGGVTPYGGGAQGYDPSAVSREVGNQLLLKDITERYPELDPRTAGNAEEAQKRQYKLTGALGAAASIQNMARVEGKQLSDMEAFDRALMTTSDDALEKAKEKGRLMGRQEELTRGLGDSPKKGSSPGKEPSEDPEDVALQKQIDKLTGADRY